MPELNLLCALSDRSQQSEQPLTKHLIVEVTPAVTGPATIATGASPAGG